MTLGPEQGASYYDAWYAGRIQATTVPDEADFVYGPLLRLLAEHIAPGVRLLDYGCGDGPVALFAARQGAEVLGVDFSSQAVARASGYVRTYSIGNARFEQQDFRTAGYLGPFDVVWSSEVIEHVADDLGLVRWLARQLQPNGTLILTTRLSSDPGHRFRCWIHGFDWIDRADGHLRRYDPDILTTILSNAGVTVVDAISREGLIRTFLFKYSLGGKVFRILNTFRPGRWLMEAADAATVSLFGGGQIVVIGRKAP